MGASWCMQVQPGQEMQARPAHPAGQRAPQHYGEQYQPLSHPAPAAHQQQQHITAAQPPDAVRARWRCEENEKMRHMAEEVAQHAIENIRAGVKQDSSITAAHMIFETVFMSYMEKTNPVYIYPDTIRDILAKMGKELITSSVENAVAEMEEQRASETRQQRQSLLAAQPVVTRNPAQFGNPRASVFSTPTQPTAAAVPSSSTSDQPAPPAPARTAAAAYATAHAFEAPPLSRAPGASFASAPLAVMTTAGENPTAPTPEQLAQRQWWETNASARNN